MCNRHFSTDYLNKTFNRLTKDAVPTIWPDISKYIIKKTPRTHQERSSSTQVMSFKYIRLNIKLPKHVQCTEINNFFCIYKLSVNNKICIQWSIKIQKSLEYLTYFEDDEIKCGDLPSKPSSKISTLEELQELIKDNEQFPSTN